MKLRYGERPQARRFFNLWELPLDAVSQYFLSRSKNLCDPVRIQGDAVMSQYQFQTEVNQLLHLIIHSLYSNKEIFLREIISNSSDALDKLKYLTVADEAFKGIAFDPRIDVSFDSEKKTLTIADTGIGMNEQDLKDNLGTIARSGTSNFLSALADDKRRDSNLIGQFGVGFYSGFMVADRIEVVSRKAGEENAWKWTSDGKGSYEIEPASRDTSGTTVTLFLNGEGAEYANRWSIQDIIKRYSDHIAFPIWLRYDEEDWDETEKKSKKKGEKTEQVNAASALWKRPKTELTEKDYAEFYKTIAHDSEDPLLYLHTRAEGTLEYTTLFYIPKKAPFDLYQVDYRPGVKLYVKRVFITDDDKELMPSYLRFLRGVIDSEDLPLNVSREILQQNKILTNIRSASVKKVLSELESIAKGNAEKYTAFIGEYNRPLKEGLYSDFSNKETLVELVRFKSTGVEGWTSLADYTGRMKEDQKAVYYITGGDEKNLRASPLLEAYKKNGIEVLIADDEIDEIVIPTIGKYKDKEIKSINRSGAEKDFEGAKDDAAAKDMAPAAEKLKKALGDRVKDVRISSRLTDSPCCLVMDEDDPSLQMQQMLKAMGQKDMPEVKPILEINPDHDLVRRVRETEDEGTIADIGEVLLGQGLLVEGMQLRNPADFVQRLNRLLGK
jgi:molecular chaperone HtpG